MGKKILSQVQVKISKTSSEKRQQLNSLIKVLRPKVYITDSSSFKSLVQELTGNGNSSISSQSSPSPSPSPSSELPQIVEKVPVVIDVDEDNHGNPESSMESSFDASVESSFQVCNDLGLHEEINQAYDPLPFDDTTFSEHFFMNGDLQSLLLDVDNELLYPSFDVYSQIQQEVSIYDYELSGLI